MTITIRVKLFATLAGQAPGAASGVPFDLEIAEGATIGSLLEQIALPARQVKVIFVNGRARPNDWPLQAGDEVGIFPPVGGG